MDPDACLKEIRELIKVVWDSDLESHDALRLAELIDSLDHWMSRGGFLPKDWRKAR